MINPEMICKQCGSVLSAVTFTCVRGEYCKPGAKRYGPQEQPPPKQQREARIEGKGRK